VQSLQFVNNPYGFALGNHGRYGEVWAMKLLSRGETMLVTSHPDHIKSVFTASTEDMPSVTGDSPLRPIVGPYSVLTLVGEEHMRQRKLLLPPFHGDAVARYVQMIEQITAAEIDSWKPGSSFALAPRMQAVTLEVIMRGVLGIDEPGPWTSHERRFREAIRFFLNISNSRLYPLAELLNARRTEPTGALKLFVSTIDRELYPIIKARQAQGVEDGRHDVFSLLLAARDEQGRPMSTRELRDELISLILAGHETTANSLAWTFERLTRNPSPYEALRGAVRHGSDEEAAAYVEATIHEGMRVRPVISFTARMAQRPWRFGDYVVPKGTPVALSIVGVQHREDVYPDAHAFRPQRFLDADGRFVKPGTYTWIPFGGGKRRCLGATLAMAEQRVVLKQLAQRVDFATTSAPAERARQRNVTSIPVDGGKVTVLSRN
jgi:cytochrome P450